LHFDALVSIGTDTTTLNEGIPMIRKKLGWAAPVVALVLLTSACGVRTNTRDLNPAITRAPTCEDAIDTYTSRSQVPHDYYELAWISAEGNSVYTSEGKIASQVRKKAAEVGANAVIVNDFKESGATAKVVGAALGSTSADTKVSALAIYMPAEADRVTLKCGH
jgi:hypothetical protein